jgi:hypothetical protein
VSGWPGDAEPLACAPVVGPNDPPGTLRVAVTHSPREVRSGWVGVRVPARCTEVRWPNRTLTTTQAEPMAPPEASADEELPEASGPAARPLDPAAGTAVCAIATPAHSQLSKHAATAIAPKR